MASKYSPTIGIEIHAELKTVTKMFCRSKNDSLEERPNVNVCPVCMAHPGSLPVINREAIRHVLRVGVALGSKLADYTEFDRKNYFYPDLPKGYQISQYEFPLVSGGTLNGVEITRVHLEEDTASSIHDDATGTTLIDYNRAGVPLMELVTEPVVKSAAQAGAFARELQLLLRTLGVSDADMEKGQMRVEANISISKDSTLGTKVEVKNLNSFRAMERAVAYEIERQEKVLESGEKVVQETRGWDENKQSTFAQRIKEGSADYRYFPDPDLPSMKISEIPELNRENLEQNMPELPWQIRERYTKMNIKSEDVELYVREPAFGMFFDAVIADNSSPEYVQLASNYIANDLVKIVRDTVERDTENLNKVPISVGSFKKIVELLLNKKISSRAGKDLLVASISDDRDPEAIAKEKGLMQISDSSGLIAAVKSVVEQNSAVAAEYKSGKLTVLEFLVGQCMKALKGAADPAALRKLLEEELRG